MMIRRMAAADAETVARLTTELGYPSTPDDIVRRFARIGGSTEQAVFVAEEQGRVLGWLHVAAHPYLEVDPSAEILGLVVGDGARSRGIGASLVAAAEEWALAHDCTRMRVRSRITRDRAHSFYEGHGYQRVKTQHCFEKALESGGQPVKG